MNKRTNPRNAIPALVAAALLAACSASDHAQPTVSAAPRRPNVLFVTFDTTRYDRLGFTGDPEARTPNLDALAARGLVFDRAFASVPITLPSHTTMMTGLEPPVHGVRNNGGYTVPDEVETLAERLKQAGYDTAAFVAARVLDSSYRLDQGFDVYGDRTERRGGRLNFGVPQRPAEDVTDEAVEWLEKRRSDYTLRAQEAAPFFLWAHYYDAHAPRRTPPGFASMLDTYAAEIAYADQQFGRLLERVSLEPGDLLVVFTADHGESFGQHGEDTHATIAYDATLHVPLVLAGAGVPEGLRSDAYVRHVDLVPTLLKRLGLTVPPELSGRDLLAVARGQDDREDKEVLGYFECLLPADNLGWAPIQGVRTARWKYTARPTPKELYDVLADPDELDERSASEPETAARLQAEFERLAATWPETSAGSSADKLDEEEMERLAALGYVEARASYASGQEPDPRRYAHAHSFVNRARSEANAGNFDAAIHTLEALSSSPALRALAVRTLGPIYAEAGLYDQAIRAYETDLELTGARTALVRLAEAHLSAGRPEVALERLDELGDSSPRARMVRARALYRLDRLEEARAEVELAYANFPVRARRARAALAIEFTPDDAEQELRSLRAASPRDAVVMSQLGLFLASRGDPADRDEAWELLHTGGKRAERSAVLQANLGWGAYELGRYPEAVEALERALAVEPNRDQERARLGHALAKLGQAERAREALQRALLRQPAAPWASGARDLLTALESDAAPAVSAPPREDDAT